MAHATITEKPPGKPVLKLIRRFDAPQALVWRAWTEPEALKRWFGPDGGPVLLAEVDLRAGGRFRVAFQTEDGERHEVGGVYREVQAHDRLVFTWAWVSTPERISQVTLLLRSVEGGTELTLLHEKFFDLDARDRHVCGWTGSIEKLDAYLHQF